MKYIKELDSIRAIAVLLVIINHWIPPHYIINKIPNGAIGVDIFFVLSGFLITWILLDNRVKGTKGQIKRGVILKNFYMRRTLRIFPIYYLVIFSLLIIAESTNTHIKSAFPYYLTYTSNFYFFSTGEWDGILSHTWSLAVEEQFYLLWPSLMLFVNRKYLVYVMIGFILIGATSQFVFRHNDMGNVLTFSCFDAFGMGGLLAWLLVFQPGLMQRFYKKLRIIAAVALLIFIAGVFQTRWPAMPMLRTLISIITLFVITYIVYRGPGGKLKFRFIFSNRVLIFIGKISYGIYLYHNIIPYFTSTALRKYFGISMETMFPYKLGYIVMLGINTVILLVVAWGSWMLIEKPILSLKKYFNYEKRGQPEVILVTNLTQKEIVLPGSKETEV